MARFQKRAAIYGDSAGNKPTATCLEDRVTVLPKDGRVFCFLACFQRLNSGITCSPSAHAQCFLSLFERDISAFQQDEEV